MEPIVKLWIIIPAAVFYSCITIKPPPITFTQSQTSAEKQIVGENMDLEENGWVIASSQTSSSGADEWKRDGFENKYGTRYAESARLLVYIEEDVRRFKKKGLIGESFTGGLKPVPGADDASESDRDRINMVIETVNANRRILLEERIRAEKEQGARSLGKLEENLKQIYFEIDERGNYQESEPGKWKRK